MYVTGCGVTDSDTRRRLAVSAVQLRSFLKRQREKGEAAALQRRGQVPEPVWLLLLRRSHRSLQAFSLPCPRRQIQVQNSLSSNARLARFKNTRHSRRHEWSTNRICSKVKYQATRNVPTNSKRTRARTFPLVRNNLQHDLTIKGTWKMEIQSPLAPSHCIADGAELTGLAF